MGKTIKVKVSFTDDANNQETLTSAVTAAVAASVPTEPLSLTVTRGSQDQELDASWQAPVSNGGSAIIGYKVQWKEATDSLDTEADVSEETVTGTAYTITGLTGGEEYAVQVLATNEVGDGPASAEATETPAGGTSQPNTEPENTEPTGLPTISGAAQVNQTLTADTTGIDDADGLTNVSYSYQWIRNDGGTDTDIQDATDSTYTLTDDEVGKAIKVRVSFTDDASNEETLTSAATGPVAAETTAPGQPEHLRVFPHDAQGLDLSWEAPDSDGGSLVTGYKVQWKRATGSWDTPADVSEDTVTSTTHTINGLTEGVEYAVRVITVNDVGDGTPSGEATGTPRETVPPERVGGGLRVDGATLRVSYNEALDENSVPAVDTFVLKVVGSDDSFTWQSERAIREVDGITVTGSAVVLTLATAVMSGDQVVLSYTPPTDEAAPRIRDVAGNAAPGFVGTQAFNDTQETTPPQLDTARVDGARLTLTYDESLDGDSVSATTAFEVTVGGAGRGVDRVAVSGSEVTLTLASAVAFGDTVTVSYTAPSDESVARIRDLAGNAAPSFSGQAADNDTKPPLTVSLENKPTSHNGTNVFTFEIRFSEEFALSYKTLKFHAFNVTGGSVKKAQRLQKEPQSNIGWKITVQPDGDGDVTVVLPVTTDCESTGAICTEDGRMLSNKVEFTVSGPGG